MILRPPTSPLFPYTTLFRSHRLLRQCARVLGAGRLSARACGDDDDPRGLGGQSAHGRGAARLLRVQRRDRKSTRLNSSHVSISYAVFCLKKKKIKLEEKFDI